MSGIVKKMLTALIVLTALAVLAPPPGTAVAETLTWRLASDYPYIVHFQLYSETREWVWPNNKEVYVLDDSQLHTFTIDCTPGEKICYGAWVAGRDDKYWGVGKDFQFGCDDCCYYCDGGITEVKRLVP